MHHTVTDNQEKSRFELDLDGQIVFAAYHLNGETVVINHVEAPVALRGRGAAGQLMEGIAALIRERQQKIHPVCNYAVLWLQRHKAHHDLLA